MRTAPTALAIASLLLVCGCSPSESSVETYYFRGENGLSPDRRVTEWRASSDGTVVISRIVTPWGTQDAQQFTGARFRISSDEFKQLNKIFEVTTRAIAEGAKGPCGLPDGGGEVVHYVGVSEWKWSSSSGCMANGSSLDRKPQQAAWKANALVESWVKAHLQRPSPKSSGAANGFAPAPPVPEPIRHDR